MRRVAMRLACGVFLGGALPAQPAPLWRIGGVDDIGTQLGNYLYVVTTPKHVVILERDAPHLKVFDDEGRLRQTLGRKGAGPTEFIVPTGMSYDAVGRRLFVADPTNGRLSVFPVGDTLGPPALYALASPNMRGVCAAGGRLFAIMRNRPELVAEVVLRDHRVHIMSTLGVARTAHKDGDHPLVRTRATDGPLHCTSDGARVLVASKVFGEVHVVTLANRGQQTFAIPAFRGIGVSVDGDAMVMSSPPEYLALEHIVEWGSAPMLVATRMIEHGKEAAGYQLSRLSTTGPSPIGALIAWRPIAKGARGAICARNEPVPEIALFAGAQCP